MPRFLLRFLNYSDYQYILENYYDSQLHGELSRREEKKLKQKEKEIKEAYATLKKHGVQINVDR